MVPALRQHLEKRFGQPLGACPERHAVRMEALEGAHHGMPHLLDKSLYGGRGTRSPLRTMCTPIGSLLRTPLSLKGKTAAAGAHTALAMCVKALGLAFPMDEKSISGWHKELKKHVPNQKIPIGVAVVKHFQYIMEHSGNP